MPQKFEACPFSQVYQAKRLQKMVEKKKLMQSGNYTEAVDVLKVLNSDEASVARIFK